MAISLKQLNQFVVLSETLSFTAAAARLNMAQPPLSVSIRQLEDDLGARLFERSTGGVKLTDVGKNVLEHARRTLFHAGQFRQSAQLVASGQIGSLRIGFVASSTISLLPRSIAIFRRQHPLVDLRLSESGSSAIMAGVRDGLIDVGLVRYPTPTYPSVFTGIVEKNHYLIAMPGKHPKAGKSRLRLSDFAGDPFIMPSPSDASATYVSMMLECSHAGFVPHVIQEASQAHSILALVESGFGVALVPNVWQHLAPRAVKYRDLHGMPRRELGLAVAFRKEEKGSVLLRSFHQAAAEAGR